jgi:hypothetical protein
MSPEPLGKLGAIPKVEKSLQWWDYFANEIVSMMDDRVQALLLQERMTVNALRSIAIPSVHITRRFNKSPPCAPTLTLSSWRARTARHGGQKKDVFHSVFARCHT